MLREQSLLCGATVALEVVRPPSSNLVCSAITRSSEMGRVFSPLLLWAVVLCGLRSAPWGRHGGVTAFSLPVTRRAGPTIMGRPLYMSGDDNLASEVSENSETTAVETPVATTEAGKVEETSDGAADYPLNVPSPILLASSMVIAIASTGGLIFWKSLQSTSVHFALCSSPILLHLTPTGSLFELVEGTPQFGFALTAGIVVVGFPLTFFLFYASIKKAIAETAEDDERFLSGR